MLSDAGYDLTVVDRLAPRLAEFIFSGEDPWVYKWSADVALKFANYVSVHLHNPAYGAHLTENSILSGFVSIFDMRWWLPCADECYQLVKQNMQNLRSAMFKASRQETAAQIGKYTTTEKRKEIVEALLGSDEDDVKVNFLFGTFDPEQGVDSPKVRLIICQFRVLIPL
jgi:hypothetical protein